MTIRTITFDDEQWQVVLEAQRLLLREAVSIRVANSCYDGWDDDGIKEDYDHMVAVAEKLIRPFQSAEPPAQQPMRHDYEQICKLVAERDVLRKALLQLAYIEPVRGVSPNALVGAVTVEWNVHVIARVALAAGDDA